MAGAKDIYNGIKDGNGWQVAGGVLSIAFDFATFGAASIEKGIVKNIVKEGAEYLAKEKAEQLILNEAIDITEEGFLHTMTRHFPRSGSFLDKSKFFGNARDIVNLIKKSAQVPKTLQRGGNYRRIVDAGYNIGIDATTGKTTSIFTIITNKAGNLITAFPGAPGR